MPEWTEERAFEFVEFVQDRGGTVIEIEHLNGFRSGFRFSIIPPEGAEEGWEEKIMQEFIRQ